MSDVIDREKIERQCKGLKQLLAVGSGNDFALGELHALNLVLDGFYLKEDKINSVHITIEDKIEDIKWNLAKRHFYTGVIIKATLYLELQARGLIEHSKDNNKLTMFGATVKIANISNWSASDVERGYKFISA